MGNQHSAPKLYGKLQGEKKQGESRVLKHVMEILKPTDPQTMLEELM
jgi:hypothetical protein